MPRVYGRHRHARAQADGRHGCLVPVSRRYAGACPPPPTPPPPLPLAPRGATAPRRSPATAPCSTPGTPRPPSARSAGRQHSRSTSGYSPARRAPRVTVEPVTIEIDLDAAPAGTGYVPPAAPPLAPAGASQRGEPRRRVRAPAGCRGRTRARCIRPTSTGCGRAAARGIHAIGLDKFPACSTTSPPSGCASRMPRGCASAPTSPRAPRSCTRAS